MLTFKPGLETNSLSPYLLTAMAQVSSKGGKMEKQIRKNVIVALILALGIFGNGQSVFAEEQATDSAEEIRLSIAPAVAERGGVLLRQGQLEVAPQLRYSFQSTNRLVVYGLAVLPAIVIGTIDVADVDRTILEPSLALRYGLFDNLQFEVLVPWRYSNDIISFQSGEETTVDDTGIGDIEGGLSCQLMNEKAGWPALVASVRVKSRTGKDPFEVDFGDEIPTGSGFWGIRGILTAIKVMDPVVVFANIGYTYNISRTVDFEQDTDPNTDVGDIDYDPGDSVEWGLGFAYALSPEFSFNIQYVHQLVFRSSIDDIQFPENNPAIETGDITGTHQNIPALKFGTVLAFENGRYLDFSVAIGLSEDAPDITVQLAIPFRFDFL
jgi:hypothetical protein